MSRPAASYPGDRPGLANMRLPPECKDAVYVPECVAVGRADRASLATQNESPETLHRQLADMTTRDARPAAGAAPSAQKSFFEEKRGPFAQGLRLPPELDAAERKPSAPCTPCYPNLPATLTPELPPRRLGPGA